MLEYDDKTHYLKLEIMRNPTHYPELYRIITEQNKLRFEKRDVI